MRETTAGVLDFWRDLGPRGWFAKSDAVDRQIRDRFGVAVERAFAGVFDQQAAEADDWLALVILLDQFPRNIHRGDPRSFAGDERAVRAASRAIDAGHDRRCSADMRTFLYMPFMHSEAIGDQNRCVALMHAHGGADNLKFAILHRDIIARFGRFPHRNPILGRHTTPAEQAFLDAGGFGG